MSAKDCFDETLETIKHEFHLLEDKLSEVEVYDDESLQVAIDDFITYRYECPHCDEKEMESDNFQEQIEGFGKFILTEFSHELEDMLCALDVVPTPQQRQDFIDKLMWKLEKELGAT